MACASTHLRRAVLSRCYCSGLHEPTGYWALRVEMLPSEPSGYFERIAGDRVIGWAADSDGRPARVAVHVNHTVAACEPIHVQRSDESIQDRCRFELRLNLNAGDRVEIFHALTGRALPGGVRRAADSEWRPRVGIVAPVRQEARYLLEWIAYHRALGIESFLLGDNGGDDGTSELLQALHRLGVIQRLDWLGEINFQLRFDVDAVARMHGLVDFCSITDVDEFLRPLNGRRDIPTALAEIFSRREVSAAALSCAVYGSSGCICAGDGLVLERFTRRAHAGHKFHKTVKTVVRPERLTGMAYAHVVKLDGGEYVEDRGDPWVDEPITWNCLRVDHHVIKSREEFEQKASRGVILPNLPARDQAFFDIRDTNDEEDPMPADFLERTKRELASLVSRLSAISTTGAIPNLWTGFTRVPASPET
jgi:hypothetical protein